MISIFDNSSPKSLERVIEIYKSKANLTTNHLKIFKGNLCDKKFLKESFELIIKINKRIDGVIHFAGFKSVANSIINPLLYWKTNVVNTLNLLEIMKDYDCKNLVFSSSATLYEQKNNVLLKEDAKLGPINPYGNTKLAIETLLKV